MPIINVESKLIGQKADEFAEAAGCAPPSEDARVDGEDGQPGSKSSEAGEAEPELAGKGGSYKPDEETQEDIKRLCCDSSRGQRVRVCGDPHTSGI